MINISSRSTLCLHYHVLERLQCSKFVARPISTIAAIKKGLKNDPAGGRELRLRRVTANGTTGKTSSGSKVPSKLAARDEGSGRQSCKIRKHTTGGDQTAEEVFARGHREDISKPGAGPRTYRERVSQDHSQDSTSDGSGASPPGTTLLRKRRAAEGLNYPLAARKIRQLRDLMDNFDAAGEDSAGARANEQAIKVRLALMNGLMYSAELRDFVRKRVEEEGLDAAERQEAGKSRVLLNQGKYIFVPGAGTSMQKAPGNAQNQEIPLATGDSFSASRKMRSESARVVNGEQLNAVERADPFDTDFDRSPQKWIDHADAAGDDHPVFIPYTTAASEFLYGGNVVVAALKAKSRKIYNLYLHERALSQGSNGEELQQLAKAAGVPIQRQNDRGPGFLRMLDKMAGGRPHNGAVLEASRLPLPPVLKLGKFDARTSIIPLGLDRQTAEDVAVNGAPSAIPSLTTTWRHPLVVLLDGIVDPGNVGNILRTCHFYGVDAVAVATNTCANVSSATLAKAASGAAEALRLLALPKPSAFVYESQKNGWRTFAAVGPDTEGPASLQKDSRKFKPPKRLATSTMSSPLARHPCILMLGAEGQGLRGNLHTRADFEITIERGPRAEEVPDVGVDSMNVGVAAGVLLEAFLRKPEGVSPTSSSESDLGF